MLFTSAAFLFGFLPIFLLIFVFASRRGRLTLAARAVIIVGTYIFYSFENVGYLIPFIFATLMDLFWSHLLERVHDPRWRKAIVAASVIQNLSLLAIYKYLNWLAAVFPNVHVIQSLHLSFADENGMISLPPGISFYLFESLSFVIDCYRGRIQTPKNPLNFLTFITMFPRFIAGPIVRYADLQDSIINYRGMRFADGLLVFFIGFDIKILFADSFEKIVTPNFGHLLNFFGAWVSALAYTFQIYLDFSGYSLMAIGLGMMIGFPFADNFREPYLSFNITEFWRRWHISLSTWLRDYLYIPLGGNRNGEGRTYFNLMMTMILGGLWHGANVTFVIWGVYHGALLSMERFLKNTRFELRSKGITFLLVVFGWVYFRADKASHAERMLNAMLGLNGWGFTQALRIVSIQKTSVLFGGVGLAWLFFLEPWIRQRRANRHWHEVSTRAVPFYALIFVVAISSLALLFALADRNIPFLYFQF